MSLHDIALTTLDGRDTTLGEHAGKVILAVNVASKCGLTPQYEGLERLQSELGGDHFTVLGFPCNQFGAQEPGTNDEIATFCSATYGVTFPMFDKLDVNGDDRHPLYEALTQVADADGEAGDVQWNFEKFVISPDGEPIARIRPRTQPEDAELVALIRANLPG